MAQRLSSVVFIVSCFSSVVKKLRSKKSHLEYLPSNLAAAPSPRPFPWSASHREQFVGCFHDRSLKLRRPPK